VKISLWEEDSGLAPRLSEMRLGSGVGGGGSMDMGGMPSSSSHWDGSGTLPNGIADFLTSADFFFFFSVEVLIGIFYSSALEFILKCNPNQIPNPTPLYPFPFIVLLFLHYSPFSSYFAS
jgi:hypothetical protein